MKTFIIELIQDEELGGFTARVPEIPACGEGKTVLEAINDLKDAFRGYVETFAEAQASSKTPFSTVHDFAQLMKKLPSIDDDFFKDLEMIQKSQSQLRNSEHVD